MPHSQSALHTIPSEPARSADDVYIAIKDALAGGQYGAGQYLREEQLAKSLGVSRTPVREALRRLDAEGWVETRPNYGVRVKAWTLQDAREIFEARLLIEPYLAGRAALSIGAPDIARLKTLAAAMLAITQRPSTPESCEAWFVANGEFHAIITAAANNARLDRSLKSMKETPLIKWTFDTYSDDDRERSARQHLEIVLALEQRNAAWAEAATRCHILAAEKAVLDRHDREHPASA
ncbi:GntR family transcriptional regulator [Caballeronia ptereochthonis]|uniref:GntR family transcriptional regulator n=1 Tax=Caballeronia ptereochthonis TaxID=1777144 RepID=A0A157ZET5_9BURK|nr:GntR family transcriptional regulator [Caballeronia ptereochthonis]SAK44051.1 GntR family transcriptional regulator [Caballeronia ptereochthonis]